MSFPAGVSGLFRVETKSDVMGFGSYDESEQETHQQSNDEEGEAVNVHENDHDGDLSFESEAGADELIGRLKDMRSEE